MTLFERGKTLQSDTLEAEIIPPVLLIINIINNSTLTT